MARHDTGSERTLTLHYPLACAAALEPVLAMVADQAFVLDRHESAALDLAALNCFGLRFHGSLMSSRAPFVYPLMDEAFHKYYRTGRNTYPVASPGADWVYLGGDPTDFLAKLVVFLRRNAVSRLCLRPFSAVAGIFARERQPGDVPLTLVKQPCFHNDAQVKKHKAALLTNKPEDWSRTTGYQLVNDRYAAVEPLLARYLATPPRRIVEIGCGLGNTTCRLAREFPQAQVTGYDFSADSIAVCRRAFSLTNLEYRVADFTEPLPVEDGSVDLVVSIEATNMSAAPVFTAGECCRILADGGLVLNCSLSESSYVYWDYPASLFLPTHMNTFATDWYAVARQHGCGFALVPWELSSFTFIACRDPRFEAEHQSFAASRQHTDGFRLYQDRFAMVIGKHVAGSDATGYDAHLLERSYLGYVRRCLDTFDPADAELARFTAWSRRLVDATLGLAPQARQFIEAVMPE